MIKFIKNNSRKFYIIGSAILVLMIAVLGVLIAGEFSKNASAANTHTVTVVKTSTVTVYVSGKGVTYDPSLSTDNTEVYLVEENTSITLRAVNESRVFSSWEITGSYSESATATLTNKLLEITPTSDITIDTVRKNALLADYGEYMNASFMISLDTHLMYLHKIFEAGPIQTNIANKDVLDAYDYFFEKYSTYESNILHISNTDQADAKATAIIDNGLFTKIQNGYYKIGSSFSLLNDSFTGIGNETYPFKGVFCGSSNSTKATIFVTASGTETSGDMYRGLFQITDPEAVIRNVNIRTSLGVKANASTASTNIYAGGIAGNVNKSVISNVDVLARIAIDATSANIYAGGVAGELNGGLDKDRNITLNGKDSTFILTTNASGKNIYAGLISGDAKNVYVKEVNADTSNFAISAKNTASNTYSADTNVYLGNLFGKYTATSAMPIENVSITGSEKESITSLISAGNSYIGGLIGYLDVSSSTVALGDVSITNTSGESKLSASSVDKASQTNLLTAGLIACVNGSGLNPTDEFLDGVKEKTVDNVKHYEYEYIFNTDLLIQSVNNGQAYGSTSDASTYGKVMASGFIARGYMNLNGDSNTDRNEIFLSSGKYQTKVYATQSSTSSHFDPETGANDREHCIATAFYGNINTSSGSMQNINVYASNYDIAATRELGSKGKGDVIAAGFVSQTTSFDFSNITVYLNDSFIKGHSLSYEVANTTGNANNTFVGGFIGEFQGVGESYNNLTNILVAGSYNHQTNITSGTTTYIEAIQNSIGSEDDENCNYVGGVVGALHSAFVDGIEFYGSPSDKDGISSLTHQNPESAFCGGVIGYVRNREGYPLEFKNLKLTNTKVYAGATVVDYKDIPDIYVGGIIGATFNGKEVYESGKTIKIENAKVIDSEIIGEGNENIMLSVGGVLGSATWGNIINISDAYLVGSKVSASINVNINATLTLHCYAGGILGRSNVVGQISNCVTIDSLIKSNYANNYSSIKTCSTSSSGIFGDVETAERTVTIQNCYSNATLETSSNGSIYGICDSSDVSASNCYYVRQNAGSTNGSGTALDFSTKEVFDTYTRLFTDLDQDTASKYYIDIDKTTLFEAGTDNTSIGVKALVSNTSSFADIWINAKATGDTNDPLYYTTETDLINAGWFKLGSLVVFNGTPSTTSTKEDTNYSYILGDGEYIYQTAGEHAGKYKNNNYPYDVIDKVNYEVVTDGSNSVTLGGKSVTLESTINVNVIPNMHQIKMTFNLDPSNYYPVLYNKDGTLIQTSGLSYDEYGKFDFVINDKTYVITYSPNESIDHDDVFYIGFVDNNGELFTSSCHKFVINHNEKLLVGLIYADYTKPINYQDITYIDNDSDDVMDVVYKLRAGTITKILPVFVMSNDPTNYIISELEVSSVKYSSDSGTIKSNGEFQAPISGNGTLTVTYTANGTTTTKEILFVIVDEISVSYSSIGADVEALTYATSDNDYYLDLELLEHYGGNPTKFDITFTGSPEFITPTVTLNEGKYISKLIVTLGGNSSSVAVYGSNDDGETWSVAPIATFNIAQTYSDYSVSLSENSYNKFKFISTDNINFGILAYSVILSKSNPTLVYSTEDENTKTVTLSGSYYVTREVNLVSDGYIEFPSLDQGSYEYVSYRIGNGSGTVAVQVMYEGSSTWTIYSQQTHTDEYNFSEYDVSITDDNVKAFRLHITNVSGSFRLSNVSYKLSYSASTKNWDFNTNGLLLTNCTYTNYIVCIKKTSSNSAAGVIFTLSDSDGIFGNIDITLGNVSGINNPPNKVRGADVFVTTDDYAETSVDNSNTVDHPKMWSQYDSYTGYETRTLNFATDPGDGNVLRYDSSYSYKHLIVRIPSDGPDELRIESVSGIGNIIPDYIPIDEMYYKFASIDTSNNSVSLNKSIGTTIVSETGTYSSCSLEEINGVNGLLLNQVENYTLDKTQIVELGWLFNYNLTNPLANWNIESDFYTLKIPKEYLKNNNIKSIDIDVEFPVVYTISFDLQSDSFNPGYTGKTEFIYKVEAGTKLKDLFYKDYDLKTPNDNLTELLDALKPEINGGVKKFGFVFGGFYLIDSGNSLDAYSTSFEELIESQGDLEIYSSYQFYGRWSFLIEHIEAPGTEIKTSFEPDFMENIGLTDEEREELQLNDSITIPINNNRGYVFTVEKEEGFIGEAQVNAYIVANESHIDKNSDGLCDICGNTAEEIKSDHIREITVQKYHDNMYLYFIPAEEITGYLVIVSNVTNSSIIVGKNTASVTEQILPEDGIYTFKYVVNHKDGESYIYDSTANLLNIKRNIMIEFFTQVYDETNKATDVEERILPVGTTIEVYYSLYEDGILTDQTIGVYTTTAPDESKVYLDQFKKWNQAEDAFSSITFSTLLSGNTSTSEVYYFVVTPPNGTNTRRSTSGNEIINEVIYVGYCNEAKNDYISGMRNDDEIINEPIEDIVEGVATKESSKNEKIYSVTPSRVTDLTKTDNDNYTFTDITSYHVVDLNISNVSITDGKVVLSDDATNDTIITSSEIKGKIREIGLELGFGEGLVEVLGSTDGLSWTTVSTFLVDDVDYKYYYVDFEAKGNDFKYFKVDNKSLGEMRLASFSYNTISNAMEYKYSISEGVLSDGKLSFVNEIKGDTRHDGKTFMLAVEYTNVTDISTDVSITVTYNGVSDTIKPLLAERAGKVVVYYNLSEILKNNNVTTINITLNNATHSVEKVRLLEATSASKPAVSEERVVYPKN